MNIQSFKAYWNKFDVVNSDCSSKLITDFTTLMIIMEDKNYCV